jgi:2-desacetyl-2-hydroxyethyl bacteriochlorophyllide A dehydrogenase
MKAARFYSGNDIRIEEVPDPQPASGWVLVDIEAAGICGSDLHGWRSGVMWRPELGVRTIGHELAGRVKALGRGVADLKIGQRVGVEPLVGCGSCRYCRIGDYHLCPDLSHIGLVYPGGFAEMTTAPRDKVFPLPDNVSMDVAGFLDVYACAVHAAHRVPLTVADTVVILGMGAIGLTAGQVAKVAGARRVIVVGTRDEPLKLAMEAKAADVVINLRKEKAVEAVQDLTGGRGADAVIEAVGGQADSVQMALDMVGKGGTVGIMGWYPDPQRIDLKPGMMKEVNFLWIWSYAKWKGIPEFQISIDLLAEGKVRGEPLVTHRLPLDRIIDGFVAADKKAESGAIKVIIKPRG